MKGKSEKLIQDDQSKKEEELRRKAKSAELLDSIKDKKKQHLSRCSRFGMFFLFFWVEFMINWSTGLLSSASKEIKTSLDLNDTQFGYFALFNSSGRVIGSLVNIPLLAYVNRKWLYAAWMLGKSIFLLCFKLTNNKWLLMITRHLIGVCHMPITNYFPIWIDQFGVSDYKSFLQSGFSAVIPIGKCTGYIIHMIVGIKNWQNGFVISGVCNLIVTLIVTLIPYKNFSRYVTPLRWEENKQKYYVHENRCTVFYEDEPKEKKEAKKKTCKEDLKGKMMVLLHPQIVLLLIMRLTLFGINTAIHFWFGDYVRNGLFVEDQKKISSVYSILSMVSPVIGMGLTLLTSMIFGTYEGKHAHWVLVFFQIVTAVFGISASLMTSLIPFAVLLFVYFLANGCALPLVQGLLLYCSTEDMKAAVYSLSVLLTQLLSSGTFPILYGIINDKFKAKNPRFAFFLLMSLTGIVVIPMIIFAFLRVRTYKNADEGKQTKEKPKDEEKKNEVEKDIAEGNKEEANAEKVQNTKDIGKKEQKEEKEKEKAKEEDDDDEEEEEEEEEEDEKKDSNKNKK